MAPAPWARRAGPWLLVVCGLVGPGVLAWTVPWLHQQIFVPFFLFWVPALVLLALRPALAGALLSAGLCGLLFVRVEHDPWPDAVIGGLEIATVGAVLAGGRHLVRVIGRQHADLLAAQDQIVAERVQTVAEGVRADGAEQQVRERDAFLSVAAHELRTPVQALMGLVDVLDPQMDPRAAALLARTVAQVAQMMDTVLDMQEVTQGTLHLEPQETAVGALCRAVVQQALVPDHHLVLNLPSHPLWARVDGHRLAGVLAALVDNAIVYSPAGTTVTLTLGVTPEDVLVLTVRDQGPGIPESERARVLTRYWRVGPRADGARTRQSGLGLSLYLAQQVIIAHGGTLMLHDPPDGAGGLLVQITLPWTWD